MHVSLHDLFGTRDRLVAEQQTEAAKIRQITDDTQAALKQAADESQATAKELADNDAAISRVLSTPQAVGKVIGPFDEPDGSKTVVVPKGGGKWEKVPILDAATEIEVPDPETPPADEPHDPTA